MTDSPSGDGRTAAGRRDSAWLRSGAGIVCNDHRGSLFLLVLVLLLLPGARSTGSLDAAEPLTYRLWDGDAPGARGQEDDDRPTLIVYRAASGDDGPRPAVMVCPGGGYGGLAMDHEGKQIAKWWNEHGVSAAILNYRHRGKGYGHPAPLLDAQRGLRMLRANAAQWQIDPQRIGAMGFSAGGHLASTLATHFDAGRVDDADPVERVSCRPDFLILCYPVIALDQPFTHAGSRRNLLGEDPDPQLIRQLSNQTQVTAECPPTFLFHTDADVGVPPENSVAFYLALHQAGVPAELHIYQQGPHGVGLAATVPGTASWPERCRDWLHHQGILPTRVNVETPVGR